MTDFQPGSSEEFAQRASERAIPFYQKVGRLIAAWNGAERTIKATVGSVLGISLETTELIMGSTQIRANWSIYENIVKTYIQHPGILKVCQEASDSIEELYGFRNDVVHGIWYIGKDGELAISRRLNPFEKRKSLDLLDFYIHQTRCFDLRLKAVSAMAQVWTEIRRSSPDDVPELLALIGKYQSELDHGLAQLGPAPPKGTDEPPPASPRSPQNQNRKRRPSSAQKRKHREGGSDQQP